MLKLNQISHEAADLGGETWMHVLRAALDTSVQADDSTGLIAKARQAIAEEGLPYNMPPMMLLMMLDIVGDGWRDDTIALRQKWGFSLSDVKVPVRVLYGSNDRMVPPAHGEFLVSSLSVAEGVPYRGDHGALQFVNDSVIRAVRELGADLV